MATIREHRTYLRRCLRAQRLALGLSQAGAARRCGLNRADYAGCENGHGKPVTVERLITLAESLGMRVEVQAIPTVENSTQLVTS